MFDKAGFHVVDSAGNVMTRFATEKQAMLFATKQNSPTLLSVVDVYGPDLDAIVIAEVKGR